MEDAAESAPRKAAFVRVLALHRGICRVTAQPEYTKTVLSGPACATGYNEGDGAAAGDDACTADHVQVVGSSLVGARVRWYRSKRMDCDSHERGCFIGPVAVCRAAALQASARNETAAPKKKTACDNVTNYI